jgi:hypothetical protein
VTLARRREMDRLKRLAAPLIEPIQIANGQHYAAIAEKEVSDAIVHAANLSVITLYGRPKIKEPLSVAWQRCLESGARELGGEFKTKTNAYGFNPFEELGAKWIADYFRREILSKRPGANEQEKFDAILASAPLWLLWFTWAEVTIGRLQLKQACAKIRPTVAEVLVCVFHHYTPDPWEVSSYDRSVQIRCHLPALPSGKFTKAPWSDSYKKDLKDWLSGIQKPTTYALELFRATDRRLGNWPLLKNS